MKNKLQLVILFFALLMPLFSTDFDDESSKVASKLNQLQGGNNQGREFWFSIPPVYDNESRSFENFIRLFIISQNEIDVNVTVGKTNKIVRALPNGLTVVDVPASEASPFLYDATKALPEAKVYKEKSIHILADEPVVVYVMIRYKYTSDGFLALPLSFLGKSYAVASPEQWGTPMGFKLSPWVNVTAAYDNTKLDFTLGGGNVPTFVKMSGGKTITTGETASVLMQKGDVIVFNTNGDGGMKGDGQDISGSRVNADKPVSVVTGHACANIPIINRWCDYTCEMELPSETWGNNMIIPKINGKTKPGIVKIFAKEDNTEIYRNGKYFATIDKASGGKLNGGFIDTRIWDIKNNPQAAIFTSTKPFYTVYLNPGAEEDGDNNPTRSDPFTMAITPIEQYQNEITFCTPNSAGGDLFAQNWLNVAIESDANGNIPADFELGTYVGNQWVWEKIATMPGEVEKLPAFKMNNDPNNVDRYFICKNILLATNGVFRLRCYSSIFASYSFGNGAYESYGYPTGTILSDIGNKFDNEPPTPSFTISSNSEIKGFAMDKLINNKENSQSNLADVYMKTSQSSNFKFTMSDELIAGTTPNVNWTLTKIDNQKDAKAVLVFLDRAGNDTTITITSNVNSVNSEIEAKIKITNTENTIFISNNNEEELNYRIVDLNGKLIASGLLKATTEINLKDNPAQAIFLEIINSKAETVLNRKVILN